MAQRVRGQERSGWTRDGEVDGTEGAKTREKRKTTLVWNEQMQQDSDMRTKRPESELGDKVWVDVLEAVDKTYAELVDYQEQLEARNAELLTLRSFLGSIMTSISDYLVVAEKDGRIVGCSRFYFAPEISIGFTFLERALWGGAANRIIKDLMIGHALKTAPAVWFHIGPDNLRSQAATAKLGAVVVRRETLDLGTGMAEYLTLRLSAEDWHAARPL